jgi:hypothetical protein
MKTFVTIFMILSFSIGVQAQKGKWKKAQKINSIESYQTFLNTYPQSDFYVEAKNKLVDLEYNKVIKLNAIKSYQYFLEKYPENKYSNEINKKLINLEYSEAIKKNTYISLKYFIDTYSNTEYNVDILDRIEKLDYEKVVGINSKNEYEEFLYKYPKSKYLETINFKLDSINYEQLVSVLKRNNIDSLKLIISSYNNLNQNKENQAAPIFFAKSIKAFEILFEKGAEKNLLNSSGQNCLLWHLNNFKIFEFLVESGVNPNNVDAKYGMSVLHWAAYQENDTIFEYLVNRNDVDINLKTNSDKTAMDLVKNPELVKLIINQSDFDYANYKLSSTINDNPELVKLIINKGGFDFENFKLSREYMGQLYKDKDYEYAKYILKKKGYQIITQFSKDTKFSSTEFQKRYNLKIENKNFMGLSAGMSYGNNCQIYTGWMVVDNKVYIFGTYKMYNSYVDFEFGKNTIILVQN